MATAALATSLIKRCRDHPKARGSTWCAPSLNGFGGMTRSCSIHRQHDGNEQRRISEVNDIVRTNKALAPARGLANANMMWIPGGTFLMGSNDHYPEEAPAHRVSVSGFWMDQHAMTNKEFRRFVDTTGYVTLAERPANPDDYPGAKPEMLLPS